MNEISPVLVTGGAGFLGGFVLDALRESKIDAVVLERPGSAEGDNTLYADLVKCPADLGGLEPGTVIHLAGFAHVVPRDAAFGRRFFDVNVEGTRNLLLGLENAGDLPEEFVFMSTVAVYGLEEGVDLDEETPRLATDPYGESKRQAEDLVVEWGERKGVRVGIARLPLAAGSGAPGNLGAMMAGLRRGRYLGVGSGEARRSMVLATDVARILPLVAKAGGVYHLTDSHHPSFCELEGALCRAMERPEPRRLPLAAARTLGITGDAMTTVGVPFPFTSRSFRKMTSTLTFSDERARQALGWKPSRVVDAASEIVA